MKLVAVKAYGELKSPDVKSLSDENNINELRNKNGVITFKTRIMECGTASRNNVIYPKEEMEKAINDERFVDLLKRGACYGEDDHPLKPDQMDRWVRVEMSNVTHKWTKMWFEGNTLWGECQTFTGNGNSLAVAILNGELPAFSIRVIGSAAKSPSGATVLSDITLIAVDWVRFPGNRTSYVSNSNEFEVNMLPAYTTFDIHSRDIRKAESYSILGLDPDRHTIYNLGNGIYEVIDKISSAEEVDLYNHRLNCF